jgi:hypothetical protein
MGAEGARVRLRQAVLAAGEHAPVADELRAALSLGEPFHDPGVAEFGLLNSVFALGDCFLEVISPTRPDTAAGRYLARRGGDCGYMLIFDLTDLEAARARAARLGVRVVWQIDLPDISGTHLHPADMGGAIVSIDSSRPYGSWRWGGPDWTAAIGEGAPGRLCGVSVAVAEPTAVAARWGEVLGVEIAGDGEPALELENGRVRFETAANPSGEGLVQIDVELPPRASGEGMVRVGGVRLRHVHADPG